MAQWELGGLRLDTIPFYPVSSKDGTNVQALMNDVASTPKSRIVRTRVVRVRWNFEGRQHTKAIDVRTVEAEYSTAPAHVTAGSVAAAFVQHWKDLGNHPRDVIVANTHTAVPHRAVTALPPPSAISSFIFHLRGRQPLTAGIYCEVYDPELNDVARVLLKNVEQREEALCGAEMAGDTFAGSVVLGKDDPRWLPINAAKSLGLPYRSPEESRWTWERFLAEKNARAAPITCFRVMKTLHDLVSECKATATIS